MTRPFSRQRLADRLQAFGLGAVEKAAGVHDHRIGALVVGRDRIALGPQAGQDAFAVDQRLGAAEARPCRWSAGRARRCRGEARGRGRGGGSAGSGTWGGDIEGGGGWGRGGKRAVSTCGQICKQMTLKRNSEIVNLGETILTAGRGCVGRAVGEAVGGQGRRGNGGAARLRGDDRGVGRG